MYRWLLFCVQLEDAPDFNRGPTIKGPWTLPRGRLHCSCLPYPAFGDETFIPRLPTSRGWGSSEPMVARVELVTSGTRTPSAALDTPCPRLRYSQLIPTAAADRRWSFLRKTHRHKFWLCRHWYRQRESNPHLTHLIAHDLPSARDY